MPDRGERLDDVRQRLIEAVEQAGTNLASLSRALGRNHAYLHQFVFRGSPKHLSAEARRTLGGMLGVEPDLLAPSSLPRPAAGRYPASRLRADSETPPSGISLTAFARRLTIARLESGFDTPAAFCAAAGFDRQRFAELEDGVDDPSMEELDRIAEASGKTFDWLIRGPRQPEGGAGPADHRTARIGPPVAPDATQAPVGENGNFSASRASQEKRDAALDPCPAEDGQDVGKAATPRE